MYKKRVRRFKLINLFFLILVLTFIFMGCFEIKKDVSTVAKKPKEDFLTVISEIPTTLDNTEKGNEAENLIVSLFEGLVEITDNNKIGPALSKGWRISNNGLDYEFLLRDDIKWSNGEQITSKDFEKFFEAILSKNNNTSCDELYSIYGAEDYKKGASSFSNVAIEAISDNILKIKLNEKDDNFLKNLTKAKFRLRNLEEPLGNYKNEFQRISYTGAYIIEHIGEDGSILLSENKNYKLDRLNNKSIKFIDGGTNEENLAQYTLGNVDILYNPSIKTFKSESIKNNIEMSKSNNINFMIINSNYGITQYLDFRKGIVAALNYSLMDSYIIKNNLGYLDFKEITMEEVEKNKLMESMIIKENSKDLKAIGEKRAKEFFSTIGGNINKEIKIIGEDKFETNELCKFINDELKKYSINIKVSLQPKEKLQEELMKKEFNIYIESVNMDKEEMKTYIEPLEEVLEKGYNLFSLYRNYDIWGKSDKVKKLYIDSNNNIIFKNISI